MSGQRCTGCGRRGCAGDCSNDPDLHPEWDSDPEGADWFDSVDDGLPLALLEWTREPAEDTHALARWEDEGGPAGGGQRYKEAASLPTGAFSDRVA